MKRDLLPDSWLDELASQLEEAQAKKAGPPLASSDPMAQLQAELDAFNPVLPGGADPAEEQPSQVPLMDFQPPPLPDFEAPPLPVFEEPPEPQAQPEPQPEAETPPPPPPEGRTKSRSKSKSKGGRQEKKPAQAEPPKEEPHPEEPHPEEPHPEEPAPEASAEEQLEEAERRLLQLAAEYDNFRKRSAREKTELYDTAKADAAAAFLPVYDNLKRALSQSTQDEAFLKGVEMTMTQLTSVLAGLGITEIPALGQPFDPNLHNAVMHIEDSGLPENTVAEVFETGFQMGDRVIRYAMVKVAN